MGRIFLSHVEADSDIALALSASFESAGFQTWYYGKGFDTRSVLPSPGEGSD
jgi:hypothetical protein